MSFFLFHDITRRSRSYRQTGSDQEGYDGMDGQESLHVSIAIGVFLIAMLLVGSVILEHL